MVELNVLEERLKGHASDLSDMKNDFKEFSKIVLKVQEAHKKSITEMETKIPMYIGILTAVLTIGLGFLQKII